MKAKAKKTPKQAAAKQGKRTIKDVLVKMILSGASVDQTLAAVKRAFPKAHTGPSDVSWYRWKLGSMGEKVPALPPRTTAKKEAKAKTAA